MNILVIGEACVDIFHYGRTTRLNPEAPTPIFVTDKTVTNEGMAANVAANLESLFQTEATVTSFNQQFGTIIKKERFVESAHNYIMLRVDVDPKLESFVLHPHIQEMIKIADAVVVSDYDKGFLSESALCNISQLSKLAFLDTKKPLSRWAEHFDYIKINYSESLNPLHDEKFIENNAERIIVTSGKDGARLGNKSYPTTPVEIMDVAGAGDSFLAGLVYCYLKENDIDKAIEFANSVARFAVSKKGVVSNISEAL
jgi:bifunctional ADP-heptose synthase (sugar kinase/adenylyltransferase)